MPQTNTTTEGVKHAHAYHAELAREGQILERRLLNTRAKWGARETFRFAVTTLVIFLVTFSALNFSAFNKQFDFWLSAQDTLAKASVTDVPNPTNAPQKLIANYAPQTTTEKNLPALNFAIAPVDNRLLIPTLGINAPIRETEGVSLLGDWNEIEKRVQTTLRDGVVHFPGSAAPGTRGNVFITGHSSFYPWDVGRYKEVFAILNQIKIDDEVVTYYEQKKYVYRVVDVREVKPTETSVLAPTDDHRLTLMTCMPLGTTLRRLIVTAMLVQE